MNPLVLLFSYMLDMGIGSRKWGVLVAGVVLGGHSDGEGMPDMHGKLWNNFMICCMAAWNKLVGFNLVLLLVAISIRNCMLDFVEVC